jgi:hypothetical protein
VCLGQPCADYQNPLRRKMYDSMKLQQQQKEIFRMAEFKGNEEM